VTVGEGCEGYGVILPAAAEGKWGAADPRAPGLRQAPRASGAAPPSRPAISSRDGGLSPRPCMSPLQDLGTAPPWHGAGPVGQGAVEGERQG